MAGRKQHLSFSLVFWAITMFIITFIKSYNFTVRTDGVWVLLSLNMIIWGAEFPDMDQMFKSVFKHRDWFTHSAIVPGLISILVVRTSDPSIPGNFNTGLLPVVAMFNLGIASHLLLDYFPTWKNVNKDGKLDIKDMKYALGWTFEGLTGKELVQKLVGTYLIHMPFLKFFPMTDRVTLTKNGTRVYLFVNAFILIGLAYWMLTIFGKL